MRNIGIIGAGNMGSAILRGLIDSDYVKPQQIGICDASHKKIDDLSRKMPTVIYYDQDSDLAQDCDMIIIAVKPGYVPGVMEEILPALNPGKCVISIAAGWTMKKLRNLLKSSGAKCLRAMPNTPALVCEGMTAICDDTDFTKEDFAFAKGIFDAIGRTVILPERLFDAATAISGSSPAYVFMMIEAMADAGVRSGLPRACAYEMASQSVLGSSLMVLQSGTHPASLKDAVCSPGGTTIDAVAALEKAGFRSAIIEAMQACTEKSQRMSE